VRTVLISLSLVACVKAEDNARDIGNINASLALDSGGVEDSGGASADDTSDVPDPLGEIDEDSLPAGSDPCRGPVKGEVVEVTDGDTIKVQTGRGVERVRLIGIDTPEVDHSGSDDECYGEEAKAFLTEQIKGKTVWLTFDRECEDFYDRTLAYVHRGEEEADFIQRLLLKGGWADSFAVSPNVSFRTLFEMDESEARTNHVGIWGECR